MRLTVGPLPPAIYWRRRVVVLGALLLFLFIVVYSCAGTGQSGANPQASIDPSANAGPVLTPETGSPPPGETPVGVPADGPPQQSTDDGTPVVGQPPAGPSSGEFCSDEEILLTPVPSPVAARIGVTINLQLKIKNAAGRSCERDVGADLQELYIKRGAEMIWSSDTCGTARGNDVQPFSPGFERAYEVSWNGRDASQCANAVAAGPHPGAGEYHLFARLGSKISEPVILTLTG